MVYIPYQLDKSAVKRLNLKLIFVEKTKATFCFFIMK